MSCRCWLEVDGIVGSRYIYLSYQLFPSHIACSSRTPDVLGILAALPGFSLLFASSPLLLVLPVQLPSRALQGTNLAPDPASRKGDSFRTISCISPPICVSSDGSLVDPIQMLLGGGAFLPFFAGLSSSFSSRLSFSSSCTICFLGLLPCPLRATCFWLGLLGDFASPK